MGGGNIKLTRFAAQSAAFQATTTGVIPIADVLNNSPLNLPVGFALSRGLADHTGLLPANTPANATYAPLPQFVTITGTVGEPKADLNKLALGGLLLKTGAGVAEKLGVKAAGSAGNVISGLGGLLTGQEAGDHQPALHKHRAELEPAEFVQEQVGGQTLASMRNLKQLLEAMQRHRLLRKNMNPTNLPAIPFFPGRRFLHLYQLQFEIAL